MKQRSNSIILAAALTLCGFCAAFSAETGEIFHANKENPGSAVELKNVLSKDLPTLLFIHSPHCGPCKRMEPKLKALAKVKTDLKIVDMLLDSPKAKGIGWDSAAAKQFDVHSVPFYILFDQSGKISSKGENAELTVEKWLKDFKIVKD